jgi:ufm1-conjugating enzyme 1
MVDEGTKRQLSQIPLLKTAAGPRDKELWVQRLKEELMALIKYVQNNKAADQDWFKLDRYGICFCFGVVLLNSGFCFSNKEGTKWFGKVWYVHELLKYEFDVEFDVS